MFAKKLKKFTYETRASSRMFCENLCEQQLNICIQLPVDVITNADISSCLNISPSTIIAAKNVLQRKYGTIYREKITKKLEDGSYKTLGQHIDWNAFWA